MHQPQHKEGRISELAVVGPEAMVLPEGVLSTHLAYLTWRYNLYPGEKHKSKYILLSQQDLGMNSNKQVSLGLPLHWGNNVKEQTEDRHQTM